MKIMSVVGARPNFMKIAPIVARINEHNNLNTGQIRHVIVHTGQHYDRNMSEAFFKDLELPRPDISLEVGSASHAVQTAEIMKRFELTLTEERPDIVLVVGDVNSTIACALVTSKIFYAAGERPLLGHIEAGLRSFDRTMPEEINRILTDHISDLLFVTEESGIMNLKNEGIPEDKLFFVGNTMIDSIFMFKRKAQSSSIMERLGLLEMNGTCMPFALVTLHRPSNVDNRESLLNILEVLQKVSAQLPIVFPAHPRTLCRIRDYGYDDYLNYIRSDGLAYLGLGKMKNGKINIVEPLGYLDFLRLMMDASLVMTDSGGIQEETTCLGVRCVTIRENTERPVTVKEGTNIVAGVKKKEIIDAINFQLKRKIKNHTPQKWDGNAASRILNIIIENKYHTDIR